VNKDKTCSLEQVSGFISFAVAWTWLMSYCSEGSAITHLMFELRIYVLSKNYEEKYFRSR